MGRRRKVEQLESNRILNNYITNSFERISENGEILYSEKEVYTKWEKEPDFIKVYYRTMLAYHNVTGISIDFICCLSKYVTYANKDKSQMKVYLNSGLKDDMCDSLGITMSMLNKILKKCIDLGILFKTERRGTFIVNPFIIAKGEWKNIRKLQCQFNFTDGKWTMIKESTIDNLDEENKE